MLTGTGTDLGAAIAKAAGVKDTLGKSLCGTIGATIATWLVANVTVLGAPTGTLASTPAGAVIGVGRFSFTLDGDSLGAAIATAIGAADAAAIALWKKFGSALVGHMKSNGRANPTLFVSTQTPASPGPVNGTGTLSFTQAMSPVLASQMGLSDANVAAWNAIGDAVIDHLTTNTQVGVASGAPTGFTSPAASGPLTGTSVIK